MFSQNTDKPLVYLSFMVLLAIVIPIVVLPEASGRVIDWAFGVVTAKFSWLFLLAGFGFVGTLLVIAFSKYGSIRMGADKPQYSDFSWFAMLFTAGVTAAIIYWSVIEWGYYIDGPPLNIAARTREAKEWALAYGIFHWGPTGWAFYTVLSLPFAYMLFVKKQSHCDMLNLCKPALPSIGNSWGMVFNLLFVVSLLAGVATSLGLGTPLLTEIANQLMGTGNGYDIQLAVIIAITVVFSWSVYSGLDKGIKNLSKIATIMILVLLMYTLIFGPTIFILEAFSNSLGLILGNFIEISLWTDVTNANAKFTHWWTVFYWAWWAVYGPFMGMFIARISQGRTIRQMVFGALGYGTLGSAVCFSIFGGYAMNLELSGVLEVTKVMKDSGDPMAIAQVFASLPAGKLVLVFLGVAALIMLATTFDSASYTLAMISSKDLKPGVDPDRNLRLIWCFAIAILPIGLLFLGGLGPLRTVSIVMGLPMLILLTLGLKSFLNMVNKKLLS